MFKYNSTGVLEVDNYKLTEKLNSCKVNHFSKLNSNDEKIQRVCKMFKENSRYVFSQLQVIYWKYFKENELENFNFKVIDKIIKMKDTNIQLNCGMILHNIVKEL